MLGKLRNMTSIYLRKGDNILLLFRQGGRFTEKIYVGAANNTGVEFIKLEEN